MVQVSGAFLSTKSRIAQSTAYAVKRLVISGVHVPAQAVRTGHTALLFAVVTESLVEYLARSRCSVNAGGETGLG